MSAPHHGTASLTLDFSARQPGQGPRLERQSSEGSSA